jgi:signal peptidase I
MKYHRFGASDTSRQEKDQQRMTDRDESPQDAALTAPRDPHHNNGAAPPPEIDTTAAPDGETTAIEDEKKKQPSLIREVIETLILALIIFLAVRAVVLNFRVEGLSMSPNFHNREMLLVNRNIYFHFDLNALLNWVPGVDRKGQDIVYPFHPPERGDVIVFNPPLPNADKPFIKRVIGLPGETVEVKEGGVYIDGQRLDEPYLHGVETHCYQQLNCPPVTLPKGYIFVMGDNRGNSEDSRAFGPVPINNIIGKAWVTYWPPDDVGVVPHHDYPDINDKPQSSAAPGDGDRITIAISGPIVYDERSAIAIYR